jgi:pimeloyl-ACP methyl ester carboxylesterase
MSSSMFSYFPNGSIKTSDNITLRYFSTGSGPVMLLIHGWSQSAAQWAKQISEFSKTHHVIAVDLRGHGESEKPEYGYRIPRLATDIHELITQLDLNNIIAVGHSMGCCVLWSHIDLFTSSRFSKLILVDEPASLVIDPSWPQGRAETLGAIMPPPDLYAFVSALRSAEGEAASRGFLGTMKTASMSDEDFDFIVQQNLKMPRRLAADLLITHALADWSDVLPRIKVPTLVIGGASSVVAAHVAESIASIIPGSTAYVFSVEEKGSHFMFWENAKTFNAVLYKFLE